MPDFLLIGSSFSGTETLLDWLGQHPQVHASPIRETHYFVSKDLGSEGVMDTALFGRPQMNADGTFQASDAARLVGRRDYERCFQAAHKPEALRFGEACPAYFLYPEAARRIAEQIPRCKLVAVLRHPVERALAHYASFEQQGREHLGLESALEHESWRLTHDWAYHWAYRGLSGYTAALKRYLARFPLPQIHLVRAEHLQDPELRPAAWRALLDFLEVDSAVPPPTPDGSKPVYFSPTPGSVKIADRAVLSLSNTLRPETEFYREVFSEAPFRRPALRRLAAASMGDGADSDRQTDGAPSVGKVPGGGAVFQHVLFTNDGGRDALYHRKISPHTRGAYPRMTRSGSMQFVQDEAFSFDGFFNAFYESLVAERTGMASIELRLELSGRFFVEVLRFAGGCAPHLLAAVEGDSQHGHGQVTLQFDLSTQSPLGSRLAFHLTCLSETGQLIRGGWWTAAAPRRAVQLEIVTCTYKKREFIERTVRQVAEYNRLRRDDYFITVVDNASELPDDLFPYPNVQIVRQGNVGGAGGFARGLMEGLNARGRTSPTHFLFMDDDIDLEPEMVLRAMSWLRYTKVDQCIGGGMLDLFRPTHLHELGSQIGWPKLLHITSCIPELELALPDALDKLGRPPQPHYNAWWFMTLSREAVEKHGLPLPCFIRGDDQELGFRLSKQGVSTLAVPGIAVWHMPFYTKLSAWMYYYNMYNDLLLRSLRFEGLTGEAIASAVWEEIKHYLERLEYDQAAMRVRGLEHFLLGPEWLMETDCETRFKQTLVASKEYEAEHRKDIEPTKFDAHYNPKSRFDKRWRRWIHNGHLPLQWRKPRYTTGGLPRKVMRISEWGWSDVTYFDEIGIKHALVPGIHVYRKRPEVYFGLLQRAEAALTRLRQEWPQLVAAFREHDAEMTSPAFWRRYLGLDVQESAARNGIIEGELVMPHLPSLAEV